MKKSLYLFVIIAAFAACKGKNSDLNANKEMVVLTDSSYSNASYLSDTGAVSNTDEFINNGVVVSGKSTVPEKTVAARRTTRSSGSNSGTYNSGSGTSSQGTTTTTNKKTGVSKAAKGAIIGGVGGAVAGGIIGKSGKGAIIGGVVGAAGGYIIGRSKDRKDGRVGN